MSDSLPPDRPRIYLNASPIVRVVGCGGCGLGCMGMLLLVFFLGGVFGILAFGWRTLLGY
jgi:hypothetical protein